MTQVDTRKVVLFQTRTLVVWIRRPTPDHANWTLFYRSKSAAESSRWDRAIARICASENLNPFHQFAWPGPHATCLSFDSCPEHGTACPNWDHGWEMLVGCSDLAMEFQDASLDELVDCGDSQLQRLLQALPHISQMAAI